MIIKIYIWVAPNKKSKQSFSEEKGPEHHTLQQHKERHFIQHYKLTFFPGLESQTKRSRYTREKSRFAWLWSVGFHNPCPRSYCLVRGRTWRNCYVDFRVIKDEVMSSSSKTKSKRDIGGSTWPCQAGNQALEIEKPLSIAQIVWLTDHWTQWHHCRPSWCTSRGK